MYKLDFLFLVANANLRGGTEIQTINISHALIEAGYRVKVLSIVPYDGNDKTILSFEFHLYQRYEKKTQSLPNKLCADYFSDKYLAKLLRTFTATYQPRILVNQTYDLIHILPFGDNYRIAQVFNWSILGYEKSIQQIIHKKSGLIRLLSSRNNNRKVSLRHAAITLCNDLIVLTNAAKAELKLVNSRINGKQVTVIPNPLKNSVDSAKLSSLNNQNIVFVGRLSSEKGVMRLLHIWEYISNQFPKYNLSIYGEGDMRNQMEQYINNKQLRNICFYGFEHDISNIYLSADLLLSTSDSEGFGLVFIEAFYYGVPVVSFDCPTSPKEVIADAGLLINCFDEKEYAAQAISLLQDKKKLKYLQNKAVERARYFYEKKITNQWIKLLES